MSPAARGVVVVVLLTLVVEWPADVRGDDAERVRLEALLQSDAAVHEKAVACKRLAVIGTKESVPVLARLLGDERLAHYARFGLEAIPDPSVDQALRDALGTLQGLQLIGAINSLGNRRDTAAVDRLSALLTNPDQRTAAAAAGALGRIANERSVRTLLRGLEETASPIRPSIADACLTAADVVLADGNSEAARHLYQTIRQADTPKHIRVAATLAAVQIPGASSLGLLKELLQSDDEDFFGVALQASRAVPGETVTQAIIGELDRRSPERKALLLTALADRNDKQALPTVLASARADEPVVQVAAIRGLARLGDSTVVDTLMDLATGSDGAVAAASRGSLETLPGPDVDEAILAPAHHEDPARFALLIHLAGSRRIASAVPTLLKAAESDQEVVRVAAIGALGETVGSDQLDVLVSKVLNPATPAEEVAAKAALTSAGVRMPDRDACAQQLKSLFNSGPADKQAALFELLRELGGSAALEIVVAAARDGDDVVQDAATRSLGEWLTEDVAPELLALAKSPDHRKYQVRALRGYIRVIRQFGLPVEQRAEMARTAMDAAERDEERQLVLEALVRFPSPQSLALALEQLEKPGLRVPAAQAALVIAERLAASDPQSVTGGVQRIIDADVNATLTDRARGILHKLPPSP